MFSFIPGSDPKNSKKKKDDPRANQPLDRKGRKQARQFAKGVNRFLRYNDDLLSEEKRNEIVGLRDEFSGSIDDNGIARKKFEEMAENISKTCKKAVPAFRPSLLKENIEVLFVAVVIAMGIRAYFIQQFKIPTGSMQPTLNGIIAYPAPEVADGRDEYRAADDYERPGPLGRFVDNIWFGRSHVEWRAKEDGDSLALGKSAFLSKPFLILFPRTYLYTRKGHRYAASGTKSRVQQLLTKDILKPSFRKGEILARGYIETGDMLIVNKWAYHWSKPKRGDVFVFNTWGIDGIPLDDPRFGSQHYIKRIAGVPGDHIRIEQPNLLVDGEPATEPGIRRVMAAEGRYGGYWELGLFDEFMLGPGEYLALGDNSRNSLDSRNWGPVPEDNIVGKAMFVFFPFGNHFGPIQ